MSALIGLVLLTLPFAVMAGVIAYLIVTIGNGTRGGK